MSFLSSLKSAAKESHPRGHAAIQKLMKATALKTSIITKTVAVETIGNVLVIADPLTSKIESSLTGWWDGIEHAAERFDAAQTIKQVESTKTVRIARQ
jgi:hypothetical protein